MSDDQSQKRSGLLGRLFGGKSSENFIPAVTPPAEAASTAEPDVAADERSHAAAPTPGTVPVAALNEPSPEAPKSWVQRLKAGLTRTSTRLSDGITGLFTKSKLDGATLEDLEDLLIQADLGVETSGRIIDRIAKGRFEKGISGDQVRDILASEVETVLTSVAHPLVIDDSRKPHVVLVVGVNGGGKTTTIGKLAQQYSSQGLRVMLAAGDTFRAAAIDQLKIWGERTGAEVIASAVGADSSGLAFEAMKQAQDQKADVLLIDTAGRLQNKQALMEELEKVTRVIKKIDPAAPHDVILVLDATTGQNAMQQVEIFRQRAGVTGLVMTKLDGTARGGILVAIAAKHQIPVHAIGVGEGVEDLQPFRAKDFAQAIANT